jgi:sulfate permease, SulP family
LRRVLPILTWLPGYRRSLLKDDAVAAISVWALLVPQSLAYATLAGVPVQYGLYTAFAALIAYAIFGTSQQLVQGPSATVAAVSTAVITPLAGASVIGTDGAAKWAAALALAAGAVYLALGVLRMGWVSNFLSKAVLGGFILGFAIGIVIDQAYKLLGVPQTDGSYLDELIGTIGNIGDTDLTTLAVGVGSLAVLLPLRYLRPRWPRALLVVALATLATSLLDLAGHGVAVTGSVPTGLFSIGMPGVGWSDVGSLLLGSLAVVFVGYSETLAAGRTAARAHGYEIDPDRELVAQGVASGAAGFVGGFVNDGSLSKTSVADAAGQRTQMASLLNAGLVLLTMLLLASLFENLPAAALGAVVIDAMLGLITFRDLRRYYRVNRPDWVFFMGAMIGILALGIIQGIVIGVTLSLLLLIARASNPGIRRLGRQPGSDAYLDVARHDDLEQPPGIVVVRVDGPLFFADANRFRDGVRATIASNRATLRAVVLDAEAISLTDTDGADALIDLAQELHAHDVTLALARAESSILDLWRRAGVLDALGADRTFHTVAEAVAAI